ncbi:hypothetical protein Dsin_026216 [Dipteronia sinensis]|uniref:DUF4378 domain-containing protein n=1 Tax=Dipteronia sinensis TaxID=43782 RepID=A0AAD9ZXI3_9ROSI|nr:hypothetical protein Dsin_026216 [Dipteronia sinensis]
MSSLSSKQRKHFAMERRPKMLKDFLTDDSNSCSSTGFISFPRLLDHSSVRNLIQVDLDNARNKTSKGSLLQRSRSKATMISAFQALINAVKSPSNILQRISLSRTLSKRSDSSEVKTMITTVKIKDIIRWKSFCDLVDQDKSQPSTYHDHHNTTSTGSTNTTSCSSSSNASSWCDSDFTSEYYLPSWSENDVELGKKYLPTCVGRDSMETTTESPAISTVGPKDDLACEEKEQCSPVSVLDVDDQFEEDSLSCFDQTRANLERTKQKCMQNIRCFESLAKIDPINLDDDDHEWMSMEDNDESDYDEEINEVEEKAKLLLNHVMATTSLMKNNCNYNLEQMLFDFFIDELSTKRNQTRDIEEVDYQIVKQARGWINGGDQQSGTMELEACVREMDRKGRWGKFEEEEEETNIGLQMENGLLNHLLDDLLVDLLL